MVQKENMRNILIVDDHSGARKLMRSVVNSAFAEAEVADVSTLKAAQKHLETSGIDLLVMDLNLPDGNGDDFILNILEMQPNCYVVVSTIHDESERLVRALENGAKGYLLKEQPVESLVEEFRGILHGKPPLAPAVTRRILEMMRNRSISAQSLNEPSLVPSAKGQPIEVDLSDTPGASRNMGLTKREQEVLSLLAKGFSRPEVAGFLNISKHTVATHIGKIYSKLDVSSRSEAALIAHQNGLL